jgi:DNA-binding CsgD family transcriptional regulator
MRGGTSGRAPHRLLGRQALLGRREESATVDRLIAAVRAGHSGALVVRGEAGVGKSALLRYAVDAASPVCRVEVTAGVESEMELAFAGLHQLCAPMLDRLVRLPGPQREALEVAFGLAAGGTPDRFFVALAALGLLSDVAADRPLVCVIDDAQWLDRASAQVLAFVARRLGEESVALVFSVLGGGEEFAGLPELTLRGLREEDARALLGSALVGPLDTSVAECILAEAGGNPLALLELPRGLTPAELAGGFIIPDGLPLSGRIEDSYRRRLEQLPPDARRLLLVAAAEPVGDPGLLQRAAAWLGIPAGAAGVAERAGLIEIGAQVRFRHPLVRSAIYRAADPEELRDAHRALGQATDPFLDPDRRAWHSAKAVSGPDDAVADELERSAGRAQARGGLAAAAAFLERATALTTDPATRAERALRAAGAKLAAGAPGAALELLALAEAAPPHELQRARVERLRGQIAFASNRGVDALPLLLQAATRLEAHAPRLARETYLDALQVATVAGTLGEQILDAARAARAVPPAPGPRTAADRLLEGVALLFAEGRAAAAPLLEAALVETPDETWTRWPWLLALIAWELWDIDRYRKLVERQVALARDAGDLTALLPAMSMLQMACVAAGDFAAAEALLDQTEGLAEATGTTPWPYARIVLAAWRGREREALDVIAAAERDATVRGEGLVLAFGDLFTAVLRNGLGEYTAALPAAQRASERIGGIGFVARALPEVIEAAVRSGEPEVAEAALARLHERTGSEPTDWALGVEAYSTALVAGPEDAETHYRAAVERLSRNGPGVYQARAHLLYGEWLRRQRRRTEARVQLRRAYGLFTEIGAQAFAARAQRELLGTGVTVRKRTFESRDQLTAREAQIAELARDGLSNAEIATRLFISPHTVEYHLTKIFAKLDIRGRTELRGALPAQDGVETAQSAAG